MPEGGTPGGAIAISLANPWSVILKPPTPARYPEGVAAGGDSSMVLFQTTGDTRTGGGCGCRSITKPEVSLGRKVSCATARLQFNYASSTTGEADNNTSLYFGFSNLPDSGGGYLNGSTTAAAGGCNGAYFRSYPTGFAAPPRFKQGLNTIDLSTLVSGDNGRAACVGEFDKIKVYLESYICGPVEATNSQTLSNLVILP